MEGQTSADENAQEQALLDAEYSPKSLCVAYVLLIVGGICGLHHLYLGDRHTARVYLTSLGLCGCGVLLDFCRLPYLVAEANCEAARRAREGTPDTSSPPRRAYSPPSREDSDVDLEAGEGEGARGGARGGGRGDRGAGRGDDDWFVRRQEREAARVAMERERLQHLRAMFSNLDAHVIDKAWLDSRKNITACVEVLSGLSEALRRTVTVIQSPMPPSLGEEANLDEMGRKECLICFENNIDAVLLPCQHSGLCVRCAEMVLRRCPPECPVCRSMVQEVIRFAGGDATEGQAEGLMEAIASAAKKDAVAVVQTPKVAEAREPREQGDEDPAVRSTVGESPLVLMIRESEVDAVAHNGLVASTEEDEADERRGGWQEDKDRQGMTAVAPAFVSTTLPQNKPKPKNKKGGKSAKARKKEQPLLEKDGAESAGKQAASGGMD